MADSLEAPFGPLPEPESPDYSTFIEREVGKGVLNHVESVLKEIDIVGKRVVLDAADTQNLIHKIDGRLNIRQLRVFAEELIVKSPIRLPACELRVAARRLTFIDADGSSAGFDLTPGALDSRPGERLDGANGLDGPSATVRVGELVAGTSEGSRFILRGGAGQAAGPGKEGQTGPELPKVPFFQDTATIEGANCIPQPFWDHPEMRKGLVYYYGNITRGQEQWPEDGKPALPGGKPGEGGTGGTLRTNLSLANLADVRGGPAGKKADDEKGGGPGTPNPAYHAICRGRDQRVIEHRAGFGADAVSPAAQAEQGPDGAVVMEGGALDWAHPFNGQVVLRYAEDVYLLRRNDDAAAILDDYRQVLSEWLLSPPAWASPADIAAMDVVSGRMSDLYAQLVAGLDYFGHPSGWVPLLSLEIYRGVFDDELRHAIQTMYLSHWLLNATESIERRRTAAAKAIASERAELSRLLRRYDDILDSDIPKLEEQLNEIVRMQSYFADAIVNRQIELKDLAEDTVDARKRKQEALVNLKIFTTIVSLIPIGQPYTGLAMEGLEGMVEGDDFGGVATRLADSYDGYSKYAEDIKDFRTAYDKVDFSSDEKFKATLKENAKELEKAGRGIVDKIRKELGELSKKTVPGDDVGAEFEKLKNADAFYQSLLAEAKRLVELKGTYYQVLVRVRAELLNIAAETTFRRGLVVQLSDEYALRVGANDPAFRLQILRVKQRAMDRLRYYYYFFARAYEYRLLEPFKAPMQFTDVATQIDKIAQAGELDLHADQLASVIALFEAALRDVVQDILVRFERLGSHREIERTIVLDDAEVDTLNRGESLEIDLGRRRELQGTSQESDRRIVDISVKQILADVMRGTVEVDVTHAGVSAIRGRGGKEYAFRYVAGPGGANLSWKAVCTLDPLDIDMAKESRADKSLLLSLMSASGRDMQLFAETGLNTRIQVRSSPYPADRRLTTLKLDVLYSYQ